MGLVVIARYDDLPSARLAESFLVNAGLSAHLSDHSLVSIDPLMVRALGGLRLAVPASEAEVATGLLSRASAGEFAEVVEEDEAAEARAPLPWPVAVAAVLATGDAIGYAATKRSVRNWVDATGLGLVLLMAAVAIGYLLFDLGERLLLLLQPSP